MKPIYIETSIFPLPDKFTSITLGPFVLIRKGYATAKLKRHEAIHFAQFAECAVLGLVIGLLAVTQGVTPLILAPLVLSFYLIYVIEWAGRALAAGDAFEGYRDVSFELEARDNENVLHYNRDWFGWVRYL